MMKIFIHRAHQDCPCQKVERGLSDYEAELKEIHEFFDKTFAAIEEEKKKALGLLRLKYCRMGREHEIREEKPKYKQSIKPCACGNFHPEKR